MPTYDEYGIAYKDRSAIVSASDYSKVGGAFTSAIVEDGKVIGLWRRTTQKESVRMEVKSFDKFTKEQRAGIESAGDRYGNFVGKGVEVYF